MKVYADIYYMMIQHNLKKGNLFMFLILGDSRDILMELKKANWTSFVLGIVLVGLPADFTYSC